MKSKPPRGPRADGEATRIRILEAAGELFASRGLAETSSKAIAIMAEVDLASINYHFRNRDGLYRSVLAEAHQRLINLTDLQQLSDSDLTAQASLRTMIGWLVETAMAEPRPWHLRVLARELLAPSSHLHVVFRDIALPKIRLVRQMLGKITGIPADDPALTRCMLSTGAPCLMLLVGERTMPGSWGEIFLMPAQVIADHLYAFALSGLEATGHAYRNGHLPGSTATHGK